MPVIITDPEPCAKQRELMESLGFHCYGTDNNEITPWAVPLDGSRKEVLWIKLNNKAEPTLPEIVQKITMRAYRQGQQDLTTAIKQLLNIKEDRR